MITRFDIKTFRTCQDVSIEDMGPMLVFLGANGVGKTNILQAFQWVAETTTATSGAELPRRRSSGNIDISTEFVVDSGKLRYDLALRLDDVSEYSLERGLRGGQGLSERLAVVDGAGSTQIILDRQASNVRLQGDLVLKIDEYLPALPAVRTLVPELTEVVAHINEALTFWSSVAYYPLDEHSKADESGIILDEFFQRWESQRDESVMMRILHMALNKPELFSELVQLIGANGLNVIDGIEIKTLATGIEKEGRQKVYVIYFRPAGHTSEVQYEQLSLGTRRILRLVVSVLFDDRSVSLIEHPEDAVHAQLLHKVMGLLRSYADPAQFLITSHSPSVFNTMRPDEVRLVSIEEGVTQVRALTAKEQETAEQYVSTEGSLADFLEAVEGDG